MPNTIKTISLTDDDKSYLNKLLTQSTLEIRVYQCARILLTNLKRTVLKLLYVITKAVEEKRKSPMTISPG